MTTILHPSRQTPLETHLVGRDSDLLRATTLLAESRPIAVMGAAGVGKSALLRAAADARGRPTYAGVCLRSLGWMPLLPLTHALGHEVVQDDPDAVASAIAREIGDGTLLIDALHAADPDTLDVIARLAGRVALGVAYRTPVAPQLGTLLDRAGFATITLGPLEPAAATTLATLHRPRLKRARIDEMVQRAGGLPGVLVALATEDDGARADGRRDRALAGGERAPRPAATHACARRPTGCGPRSTRCSRCATAPPPRSSNPWSPRPDRPSPRSAIRVRSSARRRPGGRRAGASPARPRRASPSARRSSSAATRPASDTSRRSSARSRRSMPRSCTRPPTGSWPAATPSAIPRRPASSRARWRAARASTATGASRPSSGSRARISTCASTARTRR